MIDKKSSHYLKSSYERSLYGDDSYTTLDRSYSMIGNNDVDVRTSSSWVKGSVMP
ncbi:MAG: hypothetical protein V1906_02065 [Candidatus Woesearchaeota archaeon]